MIGLKHLLKLTKTNYRVLMFKSLLQKWPKIRRNNIWKIQFFTNFKSNIILFKIVFVFRAIRKFIMPTHYLNEKSKIQHSKFQARTLKKYIYLVFKSTKLLPYISRNFRFYFKYIKRLKGRTLLFAVNFIVNQT